VIERYRERAATMVLKMEAAGRREEGGGGEGGITHCASNAWRSKRNTLLNKEEQDWARA
jgi:hypothetical protein